jgi:hypothetical protein
MIETPEPVFVQALIAPTTVEPVQGTPDWSKLDDLFEIQYGPDHGTLARLPMPWDRV